MRAKPSGGVLSAFAAPQPWTDTTIPIDFQQFASVEIQVTGISGTWTPYRSLDGGTFVAANAYDKDGATVTGITADGLYTLVGRVRVKLTGGSAGTFTVRAEN